MRFRDRHQDPDFHRPRVRRPGQRLRHGPRPFHRPPLRQPVAGDHALASFPGLPFCYQLEPRERQVQVPKYVRPRTFTPERAFGIGGAFSVDLPRAGRRRVPAVRSPPVAGARRAAVSIPGLRALDRVPRGRATSGCYRSHRPRRVRPVTRAQVENGQVPLPASATSSLSALVRSLADPQAVNRPAAGGAPPRDRTIAVTSGGLVHDGAGPRAAPVGTPSACRRRGPWTSTRTGSATSWWETQEGAAGLERTYIGPDLTFGEDAWSRSPAPSCLTEVNGQPAPTWEAFAFESGDVLAFDYLAARAYVAVAGGIDVPLFRHSRSTYTLIGSAASRAASCRKATSSRPGTPETAGTASGSPVPDKQVPACSKETELRMVVGLGSYGLTRRHGSVPRH